MGEESRHGQGELLYFVELCLEVGNPVCVSL